jgi:hypothetical protein
LFTMGFPLFFGRGIAQDEYRGDAVDRNSKRSESVGELTG